jgi:N-acetylneuraminic acid mutarotase
VKSHWFVLAGVALSTLTACGGGSSTGSTSSSPPAIRNEWTWMDGANAVDQKGTYGTMGTGSLSNTPGARTSPSAWTDASGNLWLFGGYGIDSNGSGGDLNDLWKYSGGEWIWAGGSSVIEAKGVYGTEGTAASANVPGARYEAAARTDSSGILWLFGGLGLDATGKRGYLNDLWRYASGQWTWMSGSATASDSISNQPGVYGTEGTAAAGNSPGARVFAMSWTDASGNLWLFGGEGYDSNGNLGPLNDLWKYSEGEWAWMGGSNVVSPTGINNGIYGTEGTSSPNNIPGSRVAGVTWTDTDGSLWLFGGMGSDDATVGKCDSTPAPCLLNDLWKYSNGEWTWMGGANVIDTPGIYGTQGTAASGNFPGARWMAVEWTDTAGNVWLFGGVGFDSTTGANTVNRPPGELRSTGDTCVDQCSRAARFRRWMGGPGRKSLAFRRKRCKRRREWRSV